MNGLGSEDAPGLVIGRWTLPKTQMVGNGRDTRLVNIVAGAWMALCLYCGGGLFFHDLATLHQLQGCSTILLAHELSWRWRKRKSSGATPQ